MSGLSGSDSSFVSEDSEIKSSMKIDGEGWPGRLGQFAPIPWVARHGRHRFTVRLDSATPDRRYVVHGDLWLGLL
jgi:hypothetical protein